MANACEEGATDTIEGEPGSWCL